MKQDMILSLTNEFERHAKVVGDLEYWYARELGELLGYKNWDTFKSVIEKAKVACKNSGQAPTNHFRLMETMVDAGSIAQKWEENFELTRYACYLIAQNGDPNKGQIAFAMSYFAVQTRNFEILQKRIGEWERVRARQKLIKTETEFSGLLYERNIDDKGFGMIRSMGDKALFGGFSTGEMKDRLGLPKKRPLADFLPTITVKAKDFATEITMFKVREDGNLSGVPAIEGEHVKNNEDVRNVLIKRGIYPENLKPEEDVKKVERKIMADGKKLARGKRRKPPKELPTDED